MASPSVKAAVSLVWLAVLLCSRGMAQLCAEERMCEVSINATQSFQQYELNDGVKTCFSCLFNDAIENDTTWFIDDSPDIPLTTGDNPFGTNNNGVLEICNTTNILDSVADATPRFVCRSLTATANHSLFITLRALNPPSITPLIDPILVNESDPTLELRCLHADSEPITSEEWRGPDGTVVSTQASLILTNLNRDDSGEYTCIITNDMGESLNTSRNVTVQHAPLVTTGNDFTQTPLFDMLMLSCDYVAVPVPTSVQWFLNFTEELVHDNSSIIIVSTDTGSMLIIVNVTRNSTGNYTCMVSNLLGTAEATSMVRIQIPPAAAEGLMVPEVFKTSVELEWTIGFEGFSNVTEVDIEVFLQSDSTRVFPTVSLDGDLQNATVTNLTPLTSYIFRVYLINNRMSGRSDPAETVGTTLSLPLEAPTNLTCSATSSSTLQCSWQAPTPLNTTNPADTWMIEYQEVGVGPLVDRNTSDNSTTFVLDGLTSFTVYTAQVAGINSCGVGTYSEFFNATTLAGPPNNISAVAPSAFAIEISWTPPDANANVVVTGYTISLAEVDSTTSEVGQFVELVAQLNASDRTLFLWNPTIEPRGTPRIRLTANTTYEVRVAAVHSAGVGEPASTTVTTPSADVPQPIYIAPVVTDITQSSVVLTWFVPGGVVNSFTVEYCDNATGVCFNSSTSDGRPTVTLGVTLGILMKLTAYYVQVATNNIAFGISQYSPSATFITLAAATPVINVTVAGMTQFDGTSRMPEGVTFVLTCTSTSTVGSANWSRDASSLPPEAMVVGGVLTLTDVTPAYTGSYVCDYCGVNASVRITVLAVPTPTISSSVTNGSVVAVGTDVMLTCTSSSTFEIIVWTFGSSPLPPEATVMDGVLTLPDVTVARSGFYVCTFDGKSASFEITVEPVPVVNSGEPVDDQAEGRLIAIPCSSAGGGGSVEWSRVGGELPEQAIVSDDGTLTISSLRPEDSGQYVCTSDDGIMSAPLTLTVVPVSDGLSVGAIIGIVIGIACGVLLLILLVLILLVVRNWYKNQDIKQPNLFDTPGDTTLESHKPLTEPNEYELPATSFMTSSSTTAAAAAATASGGVKDDDPTSSTFVPGGNTAIITNDNAQTTPESDRKDDTANGDKPSGGETSVVQQTGETSGGAQQAADGGATPEGEKINMEENLSYSTFGQSQAKTEVGTIM